MANITRTHSSPSKSLSVVVRSSQPSPVFTVHQPETYIHPIQAACPHPSINTQCLQKPRRSRRPQARPPQARRRQRRRKQARRLLRLRERRRGSAARLGRKLTLLIFTKVCTYPSLCVICERVGVVLGMCFLSLYLGIEDYVSFS
jgi:hypothetical protein